MYVCEKNFTISMVNYVTIISTSVAEKCVWYINQLKTDDKPAAVAVPSFVFTSKVKEVSIATP